MKRCPNLNFCKLFNGDMNLPEELSLRYKCHFCLGNARNDSWLKCKRYQYIQSNGFCPDFIMPNSLLSDKQVEEKLIEMKIQIHSN